MNLGILPSHPFWVLQERVLLNRFLCETSLFAVAKARLRRAEKQRLVREADK